MNVQLLEEKSARHFLHNFPQSILLWANRRRRLGYLQVICGHIFFLGNTYLKIWKVHGLKYSFPFPHFLFNGKLRLVIFVAHWNLTSLISRSIGRDCSSFWKRIKKELRLINMYLLSCIQNTYKHSFLWTILRFDEETLPKAQRTRGLSSSYQSNLMVHITSSNTNLDQTVANTILISNSNNLIKFWVGIFTRQGRINQVY